MIILQLGIFKIYKLNFTACPRINYLIFYLNILVYNNTLIIYLFGATFSYWAIWAFMSTDKLDKKFSNKKEKKVN